MPAAWRSRGVRCPRAAADRATHLAVLRDVRHRGRQHAAAGQFPGGSHSRRRAPDVADQYRPSTAVDGRCPRLRLDRHARGRRAPRGDVGDGGTPETFPRPLLQLVRHARPPAARSALRLLGRQRQPGRAPDRARQRLRGMAPRPRRCDGDRGRRGRQPGARARGPAGAARRPAHAARHLAGAGRARSTILPRRCSRLPRPAGRPGGSTPAQAADLARDAGRRTGRCRERGRAVLGRGRRNGRSRATAATSRRTPRRARRWMRRLQTIEVTTARAMVAAPWSSTSCSTASAACSPSAIVVAEDTLDPELLRPARIGSAARQLRRDRQGRRAGPPLVPAGPRQ